MTAAPGETSRVPGAEPAAWARDLRPLLILLAAALLLRLVLAYVILPGSGFRTDIGTFTSWALTLAQHGPGQFYQAAGFADYPPGYLYVLWLVGELATLLAGATDLSAGAIASGLIKLPPMLADVAVGLVLYLLVRSWAGARPDAQRLGLLAAGLYLFMPVTWYDSAIWGQTDAFGALLTLLTVAALVRGNSEGATALAVLAALVKPQFGVVLLPLVGIFLMRRHLLHVGSGPRNRALAPAGLRDWFEQERGVWRLLSSAVVGLLVLLLLITPFSLDLPGFLRRMTETAGGYAYLTVNAYNPWALIGVDGRPPYAFGGGWSSDTVPLLGPIPGVLIGAMLLAAGFSMGMLRALWRDDRRGVVLVAILLSLAFFVLPTRVHERYLFPVFALLPLVAVVDRRWLWATLVLVVASFVNLHGVLTNPLYATPNLVGMVFGELFREPLLIVLSSVLHAAVFVFVVWRLRRSAAPEAVLSDGLPQPTAPAHSDQPPAAAGWSVWLTDVRLALARLTAVVPLRRDRSAALASEGGGLLGRIDLLILLLVFLAALGLRTFRLDQPRSMYFDEVYHARTAIEFLQDWEYDMPHSIYEYTHPHLAKYLMAVGIMALGNNRVTETRQLDGPVLGAAAEQRWSPSDSPVQLNGDRLYVLTPTGVDAYDLAGRQKVGSVALADGSALAIDETEHALYVGDTAGGLWRMATTDFDAVRNSAGDQPAPHAVRYVQLEGLDGDLAWLVVDDGRLLAASSGGTLVSIDLAAGTETGRGVAPGAVNAAFATVDGGDAVVVGGPDGVTIFDAASLARLHQLPTDAPVEGLALATEGVEDPTIYAAAGSSLQTIQLPSDEEPRLGPVVAMPNEVSAVYWNQATTLIHAVGRSPDGQQPTIYVAEPRSNAVFADARLTTQPLAVVLDIQPQRPAEDRLDLLAIDGSGTLHSVDIGNNAFAWRFPGVLAGALMAASLFLLARFLFARRSVAVLVGLLALVEGMLFSNARIAMNDTYVAFFIVAALTVFAPLWLGRWRGRFSLPLGLLAVGLLLGLALASKWVGAYAIGAVGLLILLRSALGRLLALLALIGLTAVLGYLAITPAANVESPQFNYLFLLLMVGLTLALAAGMTLRPMRMSADEVRLAVFGPGLAGLGLLLVGGAWLALGPGVADTLVSPNRLVFAGTALLLLACGLYVGLRLAARRGLGPLAPVGPPPAGVQRAAPPPLRGWLRPGSGRLGLAWFGALLAITIVPLAVYAASYAPWVALGNQWLTGVPEGNTGQTFLDLQRSMYDYHNYLRATHPASSPWWAWPLNLKPVWFEQEGYANSTTAVIYNTGNLVIFWLAVPAVAWAAYKAWRRRSLALGFLLIAICCLWLPWARIDRVAFQYHLLTTLPFSVLALAYFLAELWHGPTARTWLLARVAAALAIMGPALLWLLRLPLCSLARVESVNADAEVCGVLNRQLVITDIQLGGVALIALALGGLGLMLWLGTDAPRRWRDNRHWLTPLALTMLLGGMILLLAGAVVPATTVLEAPLRLPELPALLALVLLAVPAYFVLRARDARRYVVGALVAAGVWFVAWYPSIGGLPVPSRIAQVYLGFLPTWNYSFQFGNNQDEAFRGGPEWVSVGLLAAVLSLLVVALVYYLRWWLADRAERRAPGQLEAQREAG